jgi:hypothetical protein
MNLGRAASRRRGLFPFASVHELCESHPPENEYAQQYENHDAVRCCRQIFRYLHGYIICPGELDALT